MGTASVRVHRPLEDERAAYWPDVWRLLVEADDEFVPPLSTRRSTTQVTLSGGTAGTSGPVAYLEALHHQELLAVSATGDGTLAGFMSYVHGYDLDVGAEPTRCLYVSTLIVDQRHRGAGLSERMYAELLATSTRTGLPVATRTWSGNSAHLHILDRLGFRLHARLTDDRGPGIDTVYMVKEPK